MTSATEWLTSNEIARKFRTSRNRLIDLRRAGVLLPGEHYITQGVRTIWDTAATEQALRDYSRQRNQPQVGETYDLSDLEAENHEMGVGGRNSHCVASRR